MKINRRKFILTALLATPFAIIADAKWLEPQWVKIHRLRLSQGQPTHRFVHFSDLHHKGDRAHSESVVAMINSLSPDFVCFTGDIMEEGKFLPEALEVLAGVKAPMYGVPGNHDYWSRVPFDGIIKCYAATGGAWLLNEERTIAGREINLIGVAQLGPKHPVPPAKPGMKNILLFHYPAWAKEFDGQKFDLMLAGHSHGCQVRIPFYGPVVTPYAVDEYDLGLFQTKSGPLYVTSGIGWFPVPIRFNCRPEIVLVEI
ncbi:MAG TPA: metallophosphoesterase [Verrucomicrobiae bacterium]|nr:metallophosphoesterase [Verrucomicrobiae bacterium]